MSLSTTQYGYIVDPMVPFTDDKGKTIKNGFIRVFMAGTSTPVLTYRNYDGATNQEKIELDNSGRVKYNVIGSKGSLYKVVVYDAHHSQETPILTVDKIAVLGASINATGATIVTGLDSVTVQEENFIKATVEGTSVELALDPTEVTSEVSTTAAAVTAAPDYVVPLLDKTGEGDSKKISLANLFKFALDWISRLATTITSFASGDFIAVSNPTDGTRKMSKDTLLQITAQNALAGNVAPAFDPTRDEDNKYLAGESVVYEGKIYTFKVDHYGAWSSSDVYEDDATNITMRKIADGKIYYSILKNSLSIRVDDSFNIASGWKASIIKVPNGMNIVEFDNPNSNSYSYRIYFLDSDTLVVGNSAPVVYPIVREVTAGEKKKLVIPFNCTYILVSVYQDIPVNYCFHNDNNIVPVFKLSNTAFLSDGTIGSKSSYNLFVIETKNLDSKYVRLSKITSNRFTSAYSIDNSFSIGAITLYSGSEIGVNFEPYADDTEVDVPIPTGVNFILISAYNTGSFEATKSEIKKEPRQSVFYSKVSKDIPLECAYGDEIAFRATSTYLASIGGILLQVHNVAGSYTNTGWLSYGRYYVKINSPLASLFRFRFSGGDNAVYRIEAGPIVKYDDSKFTIAYLNAGCFDHGESNSPTTDPADGQEFVETWINLLKEISPDVILFSEWRTNMTTGDSFLSKRKLLNNYPCVQENTLYGGYANKSIASRFDSTAFTTVLFTNQLYAESHRNFSFSKIDVLGQKINLVVTHLELDSTIRALQIAELVTYFGDEKNVIIGGDFNCSDISEYQPFTDAGYDMANGDMWGVVYTYIGNSITPAQNVPTDNIIVKGLKLKNPRYPYDVNATDHKAVVADVYLI